MTRCKFTMLGNQCLRDLGHEGMHATDRKLPNEDQATIPTPECPDCAQAEQRGREEERKRLRAAALTLPKPWVGGNVSWEEWEAAFALILEEPKA